MDSRNLGRDRAKEWISDRRNKAILIGVIALVSIVFLQVANQKPQRNLAPLFPDCQLRAIDLQRMQIALSKAGLREFEVSNHQLLVPQQQTGKYLEAISEHNAVPNEFQSQSASEAITNPFLSLSQQVSIEREARNQKLQERLMLLPFVEQAWFEMDESSLRYGNQSTEKSALVTIRPKLKQPLLEEQIYTLSQLVCGAINGLSKDHVVIVDLTTGFAHQGTLPCADFEQKLNAQRIAFSRKQQLENRLRESLSRYVGLEISVLVEADSNDIGNQTAELIPTGEPMPSLDSPLSTSAIKNSPSASFGKLQEGHQVALVTDAEEPSEHEHLLVGANGQVTLDDVSPELNSAARPSAKGLSAEGLNEVQLTSHTAPENISTLTALERVTVIVDVPESLLLQRYGNEKHVSKIESSQRERTRTLQNYLDQFKPELERTIQAVLGVQGLTEIPVVYNLMSSNAPEIATGWKATATTLWAENWPSVAVLLMGLILISLITARGKSNLRESRERVEFEEESPNTIRLTSGTSAMDADECAAAKVQLSQMIEKDPDAAARVIENWIRDAA